jgi:hypothetical protein
MAIAGSQEPLRRAGAIALLAEGSRLVTHRGAAVVVVFAAPEHRRLSAGPSLRAVLNGAPRG